jgi:hypothetical protein
VQEGVILCTFILLLAALLVCEILQMRAHNFAPTTTPSSTTTSTSSSLRPEQTPPVQLETQHVMPAMTESETAGSIGVVIMARATEVKIVLPGVLSVMEAAGDNILEIVLVTDAMGGDLAMESVIRPLQSNGRRSLLKVQVVHEEITEIAWPFFTALLADTYTRAPLVLHFPVDGYMVQYNDSCYLSEEGKPLNDFQHMQLIAESGYPQIFDLKSSPEWILGLQELPYDYHRLDQHMYPRELYPIVRQRIEDVHEEPLKTFFDGIAFSRSDAGSAIFTTHFNVLGAAGHEFAPSLMQPLNLTHHTPWRERCIVKCNPSLTANEGCCNAWVRDQRLAALSGAPVSFDPPPLSAGGCIDSVEADHPCACVAERSRKGAISAVLRTWHEDADVAVTGVQSAIDIMGDELLEIVIVTDEQDEQVVREKLLDVIARSHPQHVASGVVRIHVEKTFLRNGHIQQKYSKMTADKYTSAPYILHMDSDCAVVQWQSECYLHNDKPINDFATFEQIAGLGFNYIWQWKEGTEVVLGIENELYEFSRLNQHVYPRELYGMMRRRIEEVHGVPFESVFDKLNLVGRGIDKREDPSGTAIVVSDFNVLGAAAFHFGYDLMHHVNLTAGEPWRPVCIAQCNSRIFSKPECCQMWLSDQIEVAKSGGFPSAHIPYPEKGKDCLTTVEPSHACGCPAEDVSPSNRV